MGIRNKIFFIQKRYSAPDFYGILVRMELVQESD